MRIKTQIILPRELVKEIDKFAGVSKRSLFFEIAAKEKMLTVRKKGLNQFFPF